MSVYIVDCYWTMYARLRIEADSPEEAEKKVHEAELPQGEYVSDSLETYVQNDKEPPRSNPNE